MKDLKWSYKNKGNKEKIRTLKDLVPAWKNKYIINVFELLLTPPSTLLKCLFTAVLIMAMPEKAPSKSLLSVWEYKIRIGIIRTEYSEQKRDMRRPHTFLLYPP